MARVIFESGDICEIEDNAESGWNPTSVDDLIVTLMSKGANGYWNVLAPETGKRGTIHESYLHLHA